LERGLTPKERIITDRAFFRVKDEKNYELRERDGSPQRKDSPPWRGGCEADGVGWISYFED